MGHMGECSTDDRSKDMCVQVKAMVDKLHESVYVFSDLRPQNTVFSNGKAFLADFDWAGRGRHARYPTGLGDVVTSRRLRGGESRNHRGARPRGARSRSLPRM